MRVVTLLPAATSTSIDQSHSGTPAWVLDGHAHTSRQGARLVNGAERLRVAIACGECKDHVGLTRWLPGA